MSRITCPCSRAETLSVKNCRSSTHTFSILLQFSIDCVWFLPESLKTDRNDVKNSPSRICIILSKLRLPCSLSEQTVITARNQITGQDLFQRKLGGKQSGLKYSAAEYRKVAFVFQLHSWWEFGLKKSKLIRSINEAKFFNGTQFLDLKEKADEKQKRHHFENLLFFYWQHIQNIMEQQRPKLSSVFKRVLERRVLVWRKVVCQRGGLVFDVNLTNNSSTV